MRISDWSSDVCSSDLQRLEDIEFHMSLHPPNGDGGMVADDLRRHHRQHFALSRIDLPRHDRAARLIRGKIKLAKAGARAGTQEPYVLRGRRKWNRQRTERA